VGGAGAQGQAAGARVHGAGGLRALMRPFPRCALALALALRALHHALRGPRKGLQLAVASLLQCTRPSPLTLSPWRPRRLARAPLPLAPPLGPSPLGACRAAGGGAGVGRQVRAGPRGCGATRHARRASSTTATRKSWRAAACSGARRGPGISGWGTALLSRALQQSASCRFLAPLAVQGSCTLRCRRFWRRSIQSCCQCRWLYFHLGALAAATEAAEPAGANCHCHRQRGGPSATCTEGPRGEARRSSVGEGRRPLLAASGACAAPATRGRLTGDTWQGERPRPSQKTKALRTGAEE